MQKIIISVTIFIFLHFLPNPVCAFFSKSVHNILIRKIDASNVRIDTRQSVDSSKNNEIYFGKASFYSKSLEGTKTSNDEIFRHNKLTAASNKFKLGTWLRVTNLSNEKSIIVRVNDRMHPRMAAKGRIVDISYLGAKRLNFVNKGVAKVKVEIVPKNTKN
jgi:rare lipoprotein A (peptidoglycan hydrolase)